MGAHKQWPPPGSVVTFTMVDFAAGSPRFVGIGVVAGEPRPHPHLDLLGVPLRTLAPHHSPVPEWIAWSDIIDAVPPPGR
ncbi:hypothetical protein V5P93_006383 [Actinokineospora auranticolor]|uniref:Uncharacterized protein n=1 Tax=Actinokineospora auranticolor TaxID=155976 RepID=A0A2S6GFR1_9PSEU|nr:hypothetical protein [Actinokineospora auranticolor]PPK64052.1 hypothetical protein CLV40_12243 [Actinokineospora auranticolor]